MKCEQCGKPLRQGDGHAEIMFLDERGMPQGEKLYFCKGSHANGAADYLRKLAAKHKKPLIEIDQRRQPEPRG